uniref:Uncharacterized protein n=1 Tax=Rhizophora mucronata TaxID=61149 RepID=A0A2P2P551_RHIMU
MRCESMKDFDSMYSITISEAPKFADLINISFLSLDQNSDIGFSQII